MNTPTKIFTVASTGLAGINSTWTNRLKDKKCEDLLVAIPPEFEGPGETYSPEDLYALSLLNCYIATFKYVAEKSKLQYQLITGEAVLSVGKGEEKSLWMEKVDLKIKLEGCTNTERALSMMEKTKAHCMIINSVKTKVEFTFLAE